MSHPSELQLLMLADGALDQVAAEEVTAHADTCTACQQQLAALRAEAGAVTAALEEDGAVVPTPVAVPPFARPTSLRGFALANLVTGLAIWLGQFLWKTLFGEVVVDGATWLTSIYLPDAYEVASATALYLLNQGTAMIDSYLLLVGVALSALTALWLGLVWRQRRGLEHLCVIALFGAMLAMSTPAEALEVRRGDDVVTIAEAETVDDTLLVASERIVIKGTVTGDLLALGKVVEIHGAVGGNLVTFAESITVTGTVGGLVLGAGSSIDLDGAALAGDVWLAGDSIRIGADTVVARNATLAAESGIVEGKLGLDLHAATDTLEVRGEVGRDLKAWAGRVRLLDGAHVRGDASLYLADADRLERADGARVDGEVALEARQEGAQPRSRYARAEFYLWQLVRLAGAVLVGLGLLWLFPGLRTISLAGGIDGLKTAGIGLVTLVSVPLIAVLAAMTAVGLPIALIGFAAWVLALYLAKIVIGVFIGRELLSGTSKRESLVLMVLSGLAVVIIATNLPWIGGVIGAVLTILGLGLIVQRLYAAYSTPAVATPGE